MLPRRLPSPQPARSRKDRYSPGSSIRSCASRSANSSAPSGGWSFQAWPAEPNTAPASGAVASRESRSRTSDHSACVTSSTIQAHGAISRCGTISGSSCHGSFSAARFRTGTLSKSPVLPSRRRRGPRCRSWCPSQSGERRQRGRSSAYRAPRATRSEPCAPTGLLRAIAATRVRSSRTSRWASRRAERGTRPTPCKAG